MSSILLEIIKELEGIVKEFRDSLVHEMKVPYTSTPEEIQALHSESIKRNTYLWGRLSNVTLRVATATSVLTRESDHEAIASARMMLDGTVKYFTTARLAAFTRRCRDLLPPSKAEFNKVSRNPNGQKTNFGVYEAIQFPEGNMAGPEIAHLSQSTQNIIIAQVSKDTQKEDYNAVRKALLESRLPLSCFILQCREMPVPSSIFTQGRPSISKTAMATFPKNPPKPETMQVGCQIRGAESAVPSRSSVSSTVTGPPWAIQRSQHSAPFRVFPNSKPRGGFAAPVLQSDCELQAKSAQPGVAGPTFTLNMAENASRVPVPGLVPKERGWFTEGCHTSQGYSPAAHQNHPSKNHHQDQIQFRESYGQLPSRLRTDVDGKQSASYGIPLHASTNTRGPALGYTARHASQLPTPQNNYRRSHANNCDQNQNIHHSGFSRATAGGAYTNGHQQQPFANPSLVVRPQLPGTQADNFQRPIRPWANHLPKH